MNSGVHNNRNKGMRWYMIVIPAVALLVAAYLVSSVFFIFAGGSFISRSSEHVVLRDAGVESISPLLRLEGPEEIDLRGNSISAGDYRALAAAFPDCLIRWDVPLGGMGEGFDNLSVSVDVDAFSPEDAELYTLLPQLKEVDLRDAEMTAADYALLKSIIPQCSILWDVPIAEELEVSSASSQLSLDSVAMTEALIASAAHFEALSDISLDYENIDLALVGELREAFPQAQVRYYVDISGEAIPHDAESLDLSGINIGELDRIMERLSLLPELRSVELMDARGKSPFSPEQASSLALAFPQLRLNYSFELFGQELSSDMRRVEYFSADIGDEGLEKLNTVMPIMHSLEYLRLDDCGTTDEAMAAFRDAHPDVKVVWRVFMGQFSCPTDTLKIWATYSLTNETAAKLKYCTDVRYMDLGHNEKLSDMSFLAYMPDLETAILAITAVEDLEPIRNCSKLNFLEIFTTNVTDISPLEDLKNLEYLNISNLEIDDISPIFGLKKLKHVNCLLSNIPEEQVEHFEELFPNTYSIFYPYGDPTDYYWRRDDEGKMTERYALLTKQIGYDTNDMSVYPKGYVTEEITMEDVPENWYS